MANVSNGRVMRLVYLAALTAFAGIVLIACIPTADTSSKGPVIASVSDTTVTAAYGGSVTLGVSASGVGPFTYAWVKGTADTVGRSDTLILDKVQLTDTGSYKCVVRNTDGMVSTPTIKVSIGRLGSSHAIVTDNFSSIVSGTTSGSIVTQNLIYTCDTGDGTLEIPLLDTVPMTTYFGIDDGSLYLWYDSSDCFAERLEGTSSTVVGTWTDPIIGIEVEIPDAFRNPACTQSEPDSLTSGVLGFRSGTYTYTVGNTSRQTVFSGEACAAEEAAADYTDSAEGIVIASSQCSRVELRNEESGETALLSSKLTNTGRTLYFQSSGDTCSMFYSYPPAGVAPVCSEIEPDKEAFFACVDDTPFYASLPAKQASVLAKKRVGGVQKVSKRQLPAPSGMSRYR